MLERRYLFELGSVPIGEVLLELDGAHGRYTYASEHLFADAAPKGRTRFVRVFSVDADGTLRASPGKDLLFPEALWLLRPPAAGCVMGLDERTGARGPLCVESSGRGEVRGTALGVAFRARYVAGILDSLVIGDARFARIQGRAQIKTPADVLAAGFDVPPGGGPLGLEPALPGPALDLAVSASAWGTGEASGGSPWRQQDAEALAQRIREQALGEPGRQTCVAHAQQFVADARRAGARALVVYGLVEDHGRAYPHAWARVLDAAGRGVEVDPTLDLVVNPSTYVPVALGEAALAAGAVYLDLAAGRRHLVRNGAAISTTPPGARVNRSAHAL